MPLHTTETGTTVHPPRRGRPTLPDARHEVVRVRLSAAELAHLDALALAAGTTRSEVVRRLVAESQPAR